jgi:hypothetical protein
MQHTDLLGQWPDTKAYLSVSAVEINRSNELTNLVGEDVLASALDLTRSRATQKVGLQTG